MKRLLCCLVLGFDLTYMLCEKARRGPGVVGLSATPAAPDVPDALNGRRSFGMGAWSRQRRVGTGRSASLERSVLRPTTLRCSVLRPVAELTTRTAFASFGQPRRECLRIALRARPQALALQAAPGHRPYCSPGTNSPLDCLCPGLASSAHQKARCGLSPRAFADALLVLATTKTRSPACGRPSTLRVFGVSITRSSASRQAVPGGGDLWGAEEHSPGVGARSALRKLTHRGCPNGANAVRAVSSAMRPLGEHRRAVGARHRPPQCESAPGTACRDAGPIGTTKAIELSHRSRRCEPEFGTVSREGAREMHWPTNGNKIRPANLCPRIDS